TGRSAGRAAVAGTAAEAGTAWPSAATAPAVIAAASGYLMRVCIACPFLLPGAVRNAPGAVITRSAPETRPPRRGPPPADHTPTRQARRHPPQRRSATLTLNQSRRGRAC